MTNEFTPVAADTLRMIIRRRIRFVGVCFALWLLIVGVRAWYIASFRRQEFIAAGERAARRTFAIPARRGRIFDAAGLRLVWHERYYDLVSTRTPGMRLDEWELNELRRSVARIDPDSGALCRNLAADEVMALEGVIRSGIRARIVIRDERVTVDSPAVRRRADAWEAENARMLAGQDGSVTVMLDRFGRWIPTTVRIVAQPRPGSDLHLKKTLAELEAENVE